MYSAALINNCIVPCVHNPSRCLAFIWTFHRRSYQSVWFLTLFIIRHCCLFRLLVYIYYPFYFAFTATKLFQYKTYDELIILVFLLYFSRKELLGTLLLAQVLIKTRRVKSFVIFKSCLQEVIAVAASCSHLFDHRPNYCGQHVQSMLDIWCRLFFHLLVVLSLIS